jgi:SAM-dependent methyltransferase
MKKNIDDRTVESFGDEWTRYDQTRMSEVEARELFENYFELFPWLDLPINSEGFDMGCGTGRWAEFVAPRVGRLNCIDPSIALNVARENLAKHNNITYLLKSLDDTGIKLASQDFGYSIGVLHHVPLTSEAIKSCSDLLVKGAPFLIYIYYSFDNRPKWFIYLWRISNYLRLFISVLPPRIKNIITNTIALFIYYPLSRINLLLEKLNFNVQNFPLYFYRNHSFYTMRTDARDRFGTPLEQRFTRIQIEQMMLDAGFEKIKFSDKEPFWCVIGYKK